MPNLVAVYLALIAVGSWALWQGQQKQRPPYINISRAQYEDAMAKWQGQHVEEYEITTETHAMFGGILTIRVTDFGNTVEELAPKQQSPDSMTADDTKLLTKYTVEGLFAQIDTSLQEEDSIPQKGEVETGINGCHMTTSVDFDATMGYPKRLIREDACLLDSDQDIRVTNFKVIGQSN